MCPPLLPDASLPSVGGGTPHKPPFLDDRGYVVHEGTSCAEYLMQRGVPAEQLLKEVCVRAWLWCREASTKVEFLAHGCTQDPAVVTAFRAAPTALAVL